MNHPPRNPMETLLATLKTVFSSSRGHGRLFLRQGWQVGVLIGLSWVLGWGLAWAGESSTAIAAPVAQLPLQRPMQSVPADPKSVDPIPTRYLPGFESYLENCSTCHLALPPEVLPQESWQEILRRPDNHYGVQVNLNRLTQLLIWDYVSTFSRPLPPNAPVPVYTEKSRYFKALHPKVDLPSDMTTKTCVACHPNVNLFDFVTLAPEWENAP